MSAPTTTPQHRLAVALGRIRDQLWNPFVGALEPAHNQYWVTSFLFLRAVGGVYAVAFLALANQLAPLLGRDGLLPVHLYLDQLAAGGSRWEGFLQLPSLMWIANGDAFMSALAWLGLALSLLLLCGYATVPLLTALWFLYLSFVNVGQLFYGYGWEILTLEAGFLALFLCPRRDGWSGLGINAPGLESSAPGPGNSFPDKAVIWLLRWLLYRVMFGAGLIKLRGDPCWWDLTCLVHHYETQPIPNPLSWYLHQLPSWFHQGGVLFNHVVELVAPVLIFGPRLLRTVGGLLIAAFQVLLILSGNLSWLNYLTLALCIVCFDDEQWRLLGRRILPAGFRVAAVHWSQGGNVGHGVAPRLARRRRYVRYALLVLVGYLSIEPVANMISPRQVMNSSFDPLHLVNTYGAFGSVGKVRREVILQGTEDAVLTDATVWKEYEFDCKPGDPERAPCVVSPYHYRLDWQIWFAAMSDYRTQPWLVHLVYKLLHGEAAVVELLGHNPFADAPPEHIRADLYEYEFTRFEDETGSWWKRRRLGEYLPAVSASNPSLIRVVQSFGWPVLGRRLHEGLDDRADLEPTPGPTLSAGPCFHPGSGPCPRS